MTRLFYLAAVTVFFTQLNAQARYPDGSITVVRELDCSDSHTRFEFSNWKHEFTPPAGHVLFPEETEEAYKRRGNQMKLRVMTIGGVPLGEDLHPYIAINSEGKEMAMYRSICLSMATATNLVETVANDTLEIAFATMATSLNDNEGATMNISTPAVFRRTDPFQNVIDFHQKNSLYDVQMTITQKCPPKRFGYLCQSICDCEAADCDIRDGCKSSLLFWILFAVIIAIINICLILCGVYIWFRLRKNRKNGKGKIGQYRPNEVVDVGRTPPRQSADHDGPVFFTTDDQDHVSGIYHARPAIAGSVSSGDRF